MSQRLRDWWTSGGFFSVATIIISAAITWGTTVATIRSDQSRVTEKVADNYNALSRQIDEVKAQINGVRTAQDGVLKLQGEMEALKQRLAKIEGINETQVQINRVTSADIARLQAEVGYMGRR